MRKVSILLSMFLFSAFLFTSCNEEKEVLIQEQVDSIVETRAGCPNILDALTVLINPCYDVIKIDGGDPNARYDWGKINFSYEANPHVSSKKNIVNIRTLLKAGEEFCFDLEISNECGVSNLPCEVCYTIPECRSSNYGGFIKVRPSNECSSDYKCSEGFTCQDGLCCEKVVTNGDYCIKDENCPLGYECVNGNCCHKITGECL